MNNIEKMNDQPIIDCTNLSFRIGGEAILQDLTLSVRDGEHVVLQGPSGSGKSTLLKILLGFLQPDRGEIRFRGKQVDGKVFKELRPYTAWLPQDLNLGTETVEKVMKKPFQFEANEAHMPDEGMLANTLEQLGLSAGDLGKPFPNLSTGQRQRVGIALCYLLAKPVVLLDEPTSALDKASKQKAADLLLSGNKTIISTSHDPDWTCKADQLVEVA